MVLFGIFLFFLINSNIRHVWNWREQLIKKFSKFKLIRVSSSWKSTHYQDQHGCFHVSMPPNIGFSFSFFLATNVILFLINFHYSFFLLDTDTPLHVASKPFLQSRNYREFTLKQQTDYYLINYLCPNLVPKHYCYFIFPFFDLSQARSFVHHFRLRDFFTVFFQMKIGTF